MGQGNAANHACSPALLIGSCAPFSGKSAVVLGLARQLLQRGVSVRLGKPLADSAEGSDPLIDDDVRFVGQILGIKDDQLVPSVHLKDAEAARARLLDGNLQPGAGFQRLQQQLQSSSEGLTLMEASGSLNFFINTITVFAKGSSSLYKIILFIFIIHIIRITRKPFF